MNKSQNPWRHHYVPVFYLKNFTSDDGHFYVYDKEVNSFPPKPRRSPKQVCFEPDRNTFIRKKDGSHFYDLETKLYQFFDTNASKAFKELNQSVIETFEWRDDLISSIEEFIALLFWRLPINDEKFERKVAESKSIRDFGLILYDGETKELLENKELHKEYLKDVNVQKSLRTALLFDVINENLPDFIDDLEWRINYWENGTPRLTSDNPLLFHKEVSDSKDILNALILPLSSDKSLVKIKKGFHGKVNPFSTFFQDMAVFHLAKKYVICSDKKYLGFVSEKYDLLVRNSLTHRILPSLFESYGHN